MRLIASVVFTVAALALAGCAGMSSREVAVAPSSPADLDSLMYGDLQAAPPTRPGRKVVVQTAPGVAPAVIPVGGPFIPVAADGPYALDSGDKLRIVVFGQDNLSNVYSVDAAGQVTMPLIGAVTARGLTTQQLSNAIAGRLKQSFIRDPSVAVEVEVYRPFFVLGEVTYPGQYPYVPHMTVENAISIAGGFTPRGYRFDVTVTRKQNGESFRIRMPLSAPVRAGDIVTVAERWF